MSRPVPQPRPPAASPGGGPRALRGRSRLRPREATPATLPAVWRGDDVSTPGKDATTVVAGAVRRWRGGGRGVAAASVPVSGRGGPVADQWHPATHGALHRGPSGWATVVMPLPRVADVVRATGPWAWVSRALAPAGVFAAVVVWHVVLAGVDPHILTVAGLAALAGGGGVGVAWLSGVPRTVQEPPDVFRDGALVTVDESPPFTEWQPSVAAGWTAGGAVVSVIPAHLLGSVGAWTLLTATAVAGAVAVRWWYATSRRAAYVAVCNGLALHGAWVFQEAEASAPLTDAQRIVDIWYSTVAPPEPTPSEIQKARLSGGKPPKTTALTGVKIKTGELLVHEDGKGWSAPVSFPAGDERDLGWLQKRATMIAKAYDVRRRGVLALPYRGGSLGDRFATLLVSDADPFATTVEWQRPTLRIDADGGATCEVGWSVGTPIRHRLWRGGGDGAVPGLYVGAPRSGKSSWWAPAALEEVLSGVVVVVMADPAKGGQSHAELAASGLLHHVAVDMVESRRLVAAVYQLYLHRRSVDGGAGRLPSREWPYVRLLLPEAGRLLGDAEVRHMVSELLSVAPAFGIGVSLDTQTSTKKALAGDDEYVQSTAMSGNLVATYLPSRGVASTLPPLAGVDLPGIGDDRPGVGYTLAPGGRGAVLARGLLVSAESVAAAKRVEGERLAVEEWAASGGAGFAAALN